MNVLKNCSFALCLLFIFTGCGGNDIPVSSDTTQVSEYDTIKNKTFKSLSPEVNTLNNVLASVEIMAVSVTPSLWSDEGNLASIVEYEIQDNGNMDFISEKNFTYTVSLEDNHASLSQLSSNTWSADKKLVYGIVY